MTADGGDHYNLVIYPQGQGTDPFGQDTMPLGIAGQLVNPDDAGDSGGLQGTLQPSRVMVISYGKKDGASGTCQLNYAADGQSLQGTCSERGQGQLLVEWKPRLVARRGCDAA